MEKTIKEVNLIRKTMKKEDEVRCIVGDSKIERK